MNQDWVFKALIICFVIWALKDRVPYIGNLPGDFYLQFGNLHLFVPFTSCILLSLAWSFFQGGYREH